MSLRRWADLKTTEFAALDAQATVAVLPLAAIEQHGPHLPLDVDRALVDAMLDAADRHVPAPVPVLVLPTQAVGYSPEHTAFAGTLTLPWDTLLLTWIAIGEGVARAGVRKLLLFNAHGGNVGPMDMVARELRARAGLIVYGCSWWNLPLGEAKALFTADEHRFGVHAGAIETSLMLAIDSGQVDMARAADFPSTSRQRAAAYPILGNGSSAKLGWHMQDYNAQGAAGNAAAATASHGEQLLAQVGAQLAALLQEIASLPLDTVVPGA
jgi:creatinine amidohydrolase